MAAEAQLLRIAELGVVMFLLLIGLGLAQASFAAARALFSGSTEKAVIDLSENRDGEV